MLKNGSKVKHIKLNIIGVIDGITKIRSLFTGNVDCDWQYRIKLIGQEERIIAPEEDLIELKQESKLLIILDKSERIQHSDQTVCSFTILGKDKNTIPIIYETNKWAYEKVRSKTAEIQLRKINNKKFNLEIIGIGHDNRCRWCKTFRTALETRITNIYGDGTFYQDGFCIFDRDQDSL